MKMACLLSTPTLYSSLIMTKMLTEIFKKIFDIFMDFKVSYFTIIYMIGNIFFPELEL